MATPSKPREVDKMAREVSRENTPDSPVVQSLAPARRQTPSCSTPTTSTTTGRPLDRSSVICTSSSMSSPSRCLPRVDEFAERVRMIGQDPPAHLLESASLASVAPTAAHTTMREMVEEARPECC